MRKLSVMKLFSRRRSESWESVRDEVNIAVLTVAATPPRQPVNIGELGFNLTKNITYRAAFGSRSDQGKEQDKFISILQEFSKLFGAFNIADFVPWLEVFDLQGLKKRMVKARGDLDSFIDRIIDEHLMNPKSADDPNSDMVDDMLAFVGEVGDGKGSEDLQTALKLTRNNIKAMIMVLSLSKKPVFSFIYYDFLKVSLKSHDLKKVERG